MKKRIMIDILLLAIAGVLIWFDQFTKGLVVKNLTGGKQVIIWEGVFKIVSHKNTGAVWGIMSNKTDLLSLVTCIILIAVLVLFFMIKWEHKRLRPMKLIAMFVIAGAVGNLIDRIKLKYVVDFLYFELIDFPVFNVADCYITVSMILILILVIFYYKDEDFNLIWPKKSK